MSPEVVRDESALPATAGALLLRAREAAGLTIDAVAQQLKLAPRQVRALEEDDYTHLPGRTFVRGFVRNYARLVQLDPEAVLDALPVGASEPALEAPTLQQTAPTMGELPVTDHSKPVWVRWAIPLTLVAIVAAAAIYEWLRPAADPSPAARQETAPAAERPAAPARPDKATTALPNPLAAPASAPPTTTAAPASAPAGSPTGSSAPAPAIASSVAAAPASPAGVAAGGEQPLVITFRDYSWTEVRERDGRVLLSKMNAGGTVQALAGVPPLDVVIGNAADVAVSYRGQPVDLALHTRQNVARFTLQ